jgi:predicted amidohydrolase YtcJ
MVRYMVERTIPGGPFNGERDRVCMEVVERNAELGVTWVHSYVSEDKTKTFCVYDAPDPEAIRRAASADGLPIGVITRVSVLDPYFYR